MFKAPQLPEAHQELLREIMERNKALYGDLRMEADGSGDGGGDGGGDGSGDGSGDGDGGDDQAKRAPKPSETLDYWKQRSRENEKRAKDNAEKAKRLDQLEQANKTEEQKRADAEAKAKAEHELLRLDNLRLRAASTHGVSGEDAEGVPYAELISGNDDEAVERSAQAIGRLVAAAKELDELRQAADDANKGRPVTGRPVGNLRSGALPPGDPASPAGSAGISEAERRFGKQEQ